MKKIILALTALAQVACTPAVEYGRRSANEPAFPVVYADPSVVLSSTIQSPEVEGGQASSPQVGAIKVRMNYQDAKSDQLIDLRKAFNADIKEARFVGNRTVVKRTVAAAITRGEFRPADRFVNFRLRITPDNFEFVDYKSTSTDYSVVDIEALSLAKTNSASLQLAGGKPVAATAVAGTSRTLTETGQVSVRVENVTTNINYDTLDVYREAERGIDLAGNTLMNVSVTAKKSDYAKQTKVILVVTDAKLSEKDKELLPQDAVLKTADLEFLLPEDLWGHASFEYVMRRVSLKSNEYPEHNQTVFYEKGYCENSKVTIVSARDLYIQRWSIMEKDKDGNATSEVALAGEFGNRPMVFLDYPSALRMMFWMSNQSATHAGSRKFIFSGKDAAAPPDSKYPKLVLKMTSENISAPNDAKWKCRSSIIY